MGAQEHELESFLRVLDEAGCLEHVILIGSWAEFMYAQAEILRGFSPNIRTRDVDFLVNYYDANDEAQFWEYYDKYHAYEAELEEKYGPSGWDFESFNTKFKR